MSSPGFTPPRGEVRFAWFGGIMEGPVGDAAALGAAVERINQLGMVHADVEVERGRFSLLFDQATVPGERMDPAQSQNLVNQLEAIVELSPQAERIESTLHCTEVYTDQAVETLFAVQAGSLECVSRSREIHPGDLKRATVDPADGAEIELPRMSRPMLIALLALFLVGGGLMAYQSGWIGQLMAAEADSLEHDSDLFGSMLAVEVQGSWGKYWIQVTRGASYPLEPNQVSELEAAAQSTAQTAAIQAVTGGRTIYLQLLNDEGKVVEARELELAGLLTSEEAIKTSMTGRPDARKLRFALERGMKKKK